MERSGAAVSRPLNRLWSIVLFFVAVFCSKGFVVSPDLYIGKSAVPAATTDYLWAFLALALWQLMVYAYIRRRMRPRVGELVFGLLFGIANFLGTALFAYDSWAFIGSTMFWFNVVSKCLGQGFAMATALTVVANLLASAPAAGGGLRLKRFPRLRALYREHTALFSAALFFVCWLPYMAAFYPGTVIYDMCVMVRQFFGLEPMATWHSVFTTCVFGSCVWLGRLLGGDNIGTLIYMLLQGIALAAALGLSMRCLRELKTGRGWQLAALAFYALTPIWGYYCMMIGKDTLYTAMLLLFLLKTVELSRRAPEAPIRWPELLFYGFTSLSACLIRNNGLYVVVPSALVLLFALFRGARRVTIGAALLSAVAAAVLFTYAVIPALGVIDNNFAGFHYVLFQQTARTLRDHADEVTEEEKAVINRVLDVDAVARVYEPWIADPVRNTFRLEDADAETQQAALADYRAVWREMLAKYPSTYLQAFIANNSGYYAFTPFMEGITYLQQAGLRFVFQNYWEPEPGELHTTQPESLKTARSFFISLATRWRTLPVLSLLYVLPVYTWLLIGAGIAMAHRRRWRGLTLFLPALLSLGVCIVSPVNDYLRYFLPIVAMAPVLLALAKTEWSADGVGQAKTAARH
ncbi:MAG: DUF6020 family protein [Eubacteriales bacterium]|nr:DUF6020 family protein [Eubacteriales bacterium]